MKSIIRLTFVTAAIFTFVAAVAQAGEPRMRMKEPGPLDERTAEYLQLTADQSQSWHVIHEELEAAMQPLVDSNRNYERQMEPLIKAHDACGIGNVMLQMQTVHEQMMAAKKSAEQKSIAVLTPDQRTKYEAIRALSYGEVKMREAH